MIKQTNPDALNEKEILKRLSAGLSGPEIQRVLAGALGALDQAGVERLLKQVGSETGAALREVLETHNAKRSPVPGKAKVKEEWERAWNDWDARIAEACDSEGEYVIQEHHWEEPYFDPLSVTHDLEPIAARMRKLIPRVFDENLDPDFSFAEAVQGDVEEIESSLPDWMDPFANEGFALGPEATACLIDWDGRMARRQRMAAFHFVDKLCGLEISTKGLGLDEKAVARFIRGLSAEAKQDVLKGIQAKRNQNPWKQALDSAHAGWFQIYNELCRTQERPVYLENCRKRISQDWTLALPVIKDLKRRKEHVEVLSLCAAALRSFLCLREGEKFDIRGDLLVERAGYRLDGQPDARLLDLLDIWREAANALQEEEIAAALQLQAELLKGWKNWDRAIAAFRCVPQPRFFSLRECLFSQWRELVAEKSMGQFLYGGYEDAPKAPHWVHALADATWEGEGSRASFCASLRQWLKRTEENTEALRQSERVLARLCLDLGSAAWLSQVSRTLERLLAYGWSDDPALRASRRKWLERLGAPCVVPELLAFWKRNVHRLVPDPGHCGGDYESCADWAKALGEINPTFCKQLLRQWSVAHHRRKNLWRALRAKGLLVPGRNDE